MENEKREHFLSKIQTIFIEKGVKALTMDDISRELGISKKTLYQICDNKSDLVKMVMEFQMNCDTIQVDKCSVNAENAIHEIFLIMESLSDRIRNLNPITLHDIQRFYPESWQVFQSYRVDFILKKMQANLLRGMKEGLYRKKMNPDIIAKIYVSAIDTVFDTKLFPINEFHFLDVYKEFLYYHLRGISSEKGNFVLDSFELFDKKKSS